MEMGLNRSIQSASGNMIPVAPGFTEPPKKRYRCELCPQWPGTDHPPAWVQHQRKQPDMEKNGTLQLAELKVPEGIDGSIVKLAYHMIAWVEAEVSKHPAVHKKKTGGVDKRTQRTYIFKETVLESHRQHLDLKVEGKLSKWTPRKVRMRSQVQV